MQRTIAILAFILFLCLQSVAQLRVVDATSLGDQHLARFIPDVEGQVVVTESYFNYLSAENNRDEIQVFPGWPVSAAGSNERGGVYANLDDDPELELIYPVGAMLHAFNIDGSIVPGWPKTLDFPTDGAASFGDIDGDGTGEIIVTTHQTGTSAFGTIYAFEIDGSDVYGFPVATEGGAVRTPTLADLNDDSALEIIITIRNWPDGLVCVYDGEGNVKPGWPVRMDYVPGSAAAVGDINGDDIPEIVTESYYGLHAFEPDGTLLPGFPYYPGEDRVFSYSTPVLADIDGDGNREIICGDHSIANGTGAIHIVKHNGVAWLDWPLLTTSWIYGPPSVGDINDDGQLDIAVGDQTLSASPVNQVYAWNAYTGEPLPGFPITGVYGINSQLILADLDGDGMIELLADDNMASDFKGQYPGFNHDGTRMEDWLLETQGSTFFINPMVLDINDDGLLDISGGGTDQGTGLTNLYLWNAGVENRKDLAVLPILQYNTRHNGVYGDTLMVGIEEQGGMETGRQGEIDIYPNPASTYIKVSFISPDKNLQSEDLQFTVYNSDGKECMREDVFDKSFKINLENYPSGIYWIVISSDKKMEGSGKFIISR
jgi:hypothetical protein